VIKTDYMRTDKPPQYTTQVNSAFHPCKVRKQSTGRAAWLGLRQGTFTLAGNTV